MDHVVINNINKYKDKHNDAFENYLNFDISFNLSTGTKYPLPVVIISFLVGEKHRATTVAGITRLLDSGATNSMIK